MNYVTTNIRIPEEDYLNLKHEAVRQRKSLSAIIRERIRVKEKKKSKTEVKELMKELEIVAKRNAKHLKGWNSLKVLQEIRNEN